MKGTPQRQCDNRKEAQTPTKNYPVPVKSAAGPLSGTLKESRNRGNTFGAHMCCVRKTKAPTKANTHLIMYNNNNNNNNTTSYHHKTIIVLFLKSTARRHIPSHTYIHSYLIDGFVLWTHTHTDAQSH